MLQIKWVKQSSARYDSGPVIPPIKQYYPPLTQPTKTITFRSMKRSSGLVWTCSLRVDFRPTVRRQDFRTCCGIFKVCDWPESSCSFPGFPRGGAHRDSAAAAAASTRFKILKAKNCNGFPKNATNKRLVFVAGKHATPFVICSTLPYSEVSESLHLSRLDFIFMINEVSIR